MDLNISKNKLKLAPFLVIIIFCIISCLWYFVEVRSHVDNEINSFIEKTRAINDPNIKIREVANFTEDGYQQAYNQPTTDRTLSSRLLFTLTNDPYFVAYYKAGACAESAALLNFYATRSGFESRIVGTNAEDHQWNEIKIKDEWIHVDPTIYYYYYTDLKKFSDYDSLWFDNPQAYTELQWYGGYSTVSVLNTGEDLTEKYCNVSILSITCQDCSYIKIKSENRVRYSVDKEIVNSESTFLLGRKNYTIIADKPIIPYLLVRQSNVKVSLLEQDNVNVTLNPQEIQPTFHLKLLVVLVLLVLSLVMVILFIRKGIEIFREWKKNQEYRRKSACSWEGIKKDLAAIDQLWKEKPIFWKVGSFFLLIGLPIILFIIQYSVITAIIPVDYTFSNLFLNYSHPNPTAMFATNYIHDVWMPEHVMSNIASIYAIMFATFIVYFIIIPILQMHSLLHFEYSDLAFFSTAVILLFGLPFAVSGISIYFGRQLSQTGGWGFSGIVWGFYAYLFFLGLLIISDATLNRMMKGGTFPQQAEGEICVVNPEIIPTDPPTPEGIALSLLLFNFVVIISPIFVILAEIGSKKIGVFGHFAGFTLGLFIAVLVMLIFERKTMRNRVILFSVLLLVIAIPSGMWMVA